MAIKTDHSKGRRCLDVVTAFAPVAQLPALNCPKNLTGLHVMNPCGVGWLAVSQVLF